MTLKGAIEREARQGKLINHARCWERGGEEGWQKGLFVRAYCIQTMQPSFNFSRRENSPSRVHDPSISGGCSRATDRPTDRPVAPQLASLFRTAWAAASRCTRYLHTKLHTYMSARVKSTSDERDNCERDGKLLSRNRLFSAHRV